MSLKKLNQMCFSPTGATRRTVQRIAGGTGLETRKNDRATANRRETLFMTRCEPETIL